MKLVPDELLKTCPLSKYSPTIDMMSRVGANTRGVGGDRDLAGMIGVIDVGRVAIAAGAARGAEWLGG